jgi:hypothetical protein
MSSIVSASASVTASTSKNKPKTTRRKTPVVVKLFLDNKEQRKVVLKMFKKHAKKIAKSPKIAAKEDIKNAKLAAKKAKIDEKKAKIDEKKAKKEAKLFDSALKHMKTLFKKPRNKKNVEEKRDAEVITMIHLDDIVIA